MTEITAHVTAILLLLLTTYGGGLAKESADVSKTPLTLTQAIEKIGKQTATNDGEQEALFRVRKLYHLWHAKSEQLSISTEVKGHFEKAVSKAEEKFNEGDDTVSSSTLTKLKLGLAGTLNDMISYEREIDIARLELSHLVGVDFTQFEKPGKIASSKLNFPYSSIKEFVEKRPLVKRFPPDRFLDLKKRVIEVLSSKKRLQLAKKNRRMTRALLVTEVANYDFGIGDEGDLFESLIIYTRVLSGYHESVYDYNLNVLKLQKEFPAKRS